MIVYELRCSQAHRFEGWFASGEEFLRQRERGLVTCPVCDDAGVERVPSARVSIRRGGRAAEPEAAPAAAAPPAAQPVAAGLPPEMLAKLRELVKSTENVGSRFPEEARKMHYEEVPTRAIRGQASPEEAQALDEEGITFASVPPFLLPDSH